MAYSENISMSLRLRWALLVVGVVGVVAIILTLVLLDVEDRAWHESQDATSKVLVDVLSNELSTPMLSNSRIEVEQLIEGFLEDVKDARTVELQWNGRGKSLFFGDASRRPNVSEPLHLSHSAKPIYKNSLWYMRHIYYGKMKVGTLAVHFSADGWVGISNEIKWRLFVAGLVIMIFFSFIIYWIAGRMSRPIELLAAAEHAVADGNFSIRLPVTSQDEIGAATRQFNRMVRELAHKEEIREQFSRYLNPKVIDKLFAEGGQLPVSHNQEVTVLFADMVSFTHYSQVEAVESVVSALNENFELFHHIINHFGGNVDKYIGDAVMAVFNHPFEDSQHVRHAVMSGLCMMEACNRLAIKRPDGGCVQFRIGLDKGEVIVGNIGARKRLEYTVIGNTVNVASRMAGLGLGVVANEHVFKELGFGFAMDDMGEQAVKGLSKPIRCVQILAETRKIKAEIAGVVDAAFAAKELQEREESFYNND
ncbi:MAG: adenylate/guanylate cyclase domain-containing protein [Mariprofundaceae bacterium]